MSYYTKKKKKIWCKKILNIKNCFLKLLEMDLLLKQQGNKTQ